MVPRDLIKEIKDILDFWEKDHLDSGFHQAECCVLDLIEDLRKEKKRRKG